MDKRKTTEQIQEIVNNAIEGAWELIKSDYQDYSLCHEGSLEGSMYYHLRNLLSSLIITDNIRIWNQFSTNGKRIDIAIVQVNKKRNDDGEHLKNSFVSIYALIELKYTNISNSENIEADEDKLRKLKISENRYLGNKYSCSIQEVETPDIFKFKKI